MKLRLAWKKLLVVGAALALAGIVVSAAVRGGGTGPEPADVRAAGRVVLPPPAEDVRAPLAPDGFVVAPGVVEPARREVRVGAPVPALVREVLVDEGTLVPAGAPLVRLDDGPERAAVDVARSEARAAEARARLSRLVADRTALLAAQGAATIDQRDRARLQAEIDAADAAARRGAAGEASARAARLTVRAPEAGTVLQVKVRPGEHWDPESGPLLVLADLTAIRVRLDVDERDVARVRVGQRGHVTADAHGARPFAGTVVEVGHRMGRKNVRTDEPTERLDTKVLEVLMRLEDGRALVQGQRVTGYLDGRELRAAAR